MRKNIQMSKDNGSISTIVDGYLFVNPTRGEVRVDSGGDGNYRAPRGRSEHHDLDFACEKGGEVLMPFGGLIKRLSYPYADDLRWKGVQIVGRRIEVKLWYLDPIRLLIGNEVSAGTRIGIAQDIGEKYDDCTPHVHMRIVSIDPLLLFGVPHEAPWLENSDGI